MDRVLFYLKTVPDYLENQFNDHMVVCVAVLAIYLFALIFSNRVADFLRPFVIAGCIGFTIYGAFAGIGGHGLQAVLTGVLALVLLVIFRAVKEFIVSSYQTQLNAKIEKKALEKAAKRRGADHQPSKGERPRTRSTQVRTPDKAPDKAPVKAEKKEEAPSEAAVDYYTETLPDITPYLEQGIAAARPAAPSPAAPLPQPAVYSPQAALEAELTGPRLGREEVYDLLSKLTALYDAQILTGDEFEAKKLLLLRRI